MAQSRTQCRKYIHSFFCLRFWVLKLSYIFYLFHKSFILLKSYYLCLIYSINSDFVTTFTTLECRLDSFISRWSYCVTTWIDTFIYQVIFWFQLNEFTYRIHQYMETNFSYNRIYFCNHAIGNLFAIVFDVSLNFGPWIAKHSMSVNATRFTLVLSNNCFSLSGHLE